MRVVYCCCVFFCYRIIGNTSYNHIVTTGTIWKFGLAAENFSLLMFFSFKYTLYYTYQIIYSITHKMFNTNFKIDSKSMPFFKKTFAGMRGKLDLVTGKGKNFTFFSRCIQRFQAHICVCH